MPRPLQSACRRSSRSRSPASSTRPSDSLEQAFKFRVSASGLRSVEHVGGLDNWLLKTSDEKLSTNARKVKKAVSKKQALAA